jgi:multidrug transporter EmrE-like cation transporter
VISCWKVLWAIVSIGNDTAVAEGHSTMDALTASIIVAVIGGIAFIAVALVTARTRIGVLPAMAARDSSSPSHIAVDLPESAKQFRVLGWLLVLLFYLAAVFCVLQGVNDLRVVHHWDVWEAYFGSQLSDRAEIVLYSRFWTAVGIALIVIGCWGQRRLRRRSK